MTKTLSGGTTTAAKWDQPLRHQVGLVDLDKLNVQVPTLLDRSPPMRDHIDEVIGEAFDPDGSRTWRKNESRMIVVDFVVERRYDTKSRRVADRRIGNELRDHDAVVDV